MTLRNKATRIRLSDFSSPPMRAFHMTWLAFFLCFFGWFGIAPLMPVIREEFHLTKAQIGNLTIASVAITVLVRLLIGWLCDHIGPRRAYTWLLILGSLPVMGVGLAHDYQTFLLFRLAIGAIGASFVITQYHTSVMFAPNVVGTANAAAAGWGNLGGGVTQMVMPLLFSGFVSLGVGAWWGWRMAMFVPGVMMFLAGIAYYKLTKDTADGDFAELRARGELAKRSGAAGAFVIACRDTRVWALFVIYGACFGMELTIDSGDPVRLDQRLKFVRFAGEAQTSGRLLGAPVRDFNVIVRRDAFSADVLHRPLVGPMVFLPEAATTWFIHLVGGQATLKGAAGMELSSGESLLLEPGGDPRNHVLNGGGEVVLVKLTRGTG